MEAHADGVERANDEHGSAVDLTNPFSDHCYRYGFMYEARELVSAADDQVYDPGEYLSAPFDSVSESTALVEPSFDSVADPFAGLCESDAVVAECVDPGVEPGGNVGGPSGLVAGSAEDVGGSDELVDRPDDFLRDSNNSVAVLSRVHPVTEGTV